MKKKEILLMLLRLNDKMDEIKESVAHITSRLDAIDSNNEPKEESSSIKKSVDYWANAEEERVINEEPTVTEEEIRTELAKWGVEYLHACHVFNEIQRICGIKDSYPEKDVRVGARTSNKVNDIDGFIKKLFKKEDEK